MGAEKALLIHVVEVSQADGAPCPTTSPDTNKQNRSVATEYAGYACIADLVNEKRQEEGQSVVCGLGGVNHEHDGVLAIRIAQ